MHEDVGLERLRTKGLPAVVVAPPNTNAFDDLHDRNVPRRGVRQRIGYRTGMSLIAERAKPVEAGKRPSNEQRPDDEREAENRTGVPFATGSSYDPDDDQCDPNDGADDYAGRHLDAEQPPRGSFNFAHSRSVRVHLSADRVRLRASSQCLIAYRAGTSGNGTASLKPTWESMKPRRR